MECDRLTNYF